jgi:glycosyltransferase involved in cell wall biosynthesis
VKILFFADSCLPIRASTLEERPLGGTETGLIRVAEILARGGDQIFIVTSHAEPNSSDSNYTLGVHYIRSAEVLKLAPYDALVAVKDWKSLLYRIPTKKNYFWTGDGLEQFSNFGIGDKRVVKATTALFAASEWHLRTLTEASGFPASKAVVVGNGVHLPYFEGTEERSEYRLIYTAAPYRGLALLKPIYQLLQERLKDLPLALHIFSGMNVYDTDRPFVGPQLEEFEQIKASFSKLKNVVFHGNVTQQQLAREYLRSKLFLYPATSFETCCITALEALAAGCVPVTSAISALPETVGKAGVLIPGVPGTKEYIEQFVSATCELLTNQQKWQEFSANGIERAKTEFSWEHVAGKMIHEFNRDCKP